MIGIVVVLGGVAALLAYVMLQPDSASQPESIKIPKSTTSSTPMAVKNTASSAPAQTNPVVITEDGQKIVWPADNAPQTEKNAFFALVKKSAKKGNVITVAGCQPSPAILEVKKGQDIEVKNTDTADYSIILGARYALPGQKTITIKGILNAGVHGYHCEGLSDHSNPQGIFFVTE